jgi:dTDP-4-amino-4,6-dideoxygalactose transaminase
MHAEGLEDVLTLPIETPGCTHIYNQFVVRGPRRDELRAFLHDHRIGSEVYYPVPFHQQPCFQDRPAGTACPVADAAAATSLALPIFGELTDAQQMHVVRTIARFYGRTA